MVSVATIRQDSALTTDRVDVSSNMTCCMLQKKSPGSVCLPGLRYRASWLLLCLVVSRRQRHTSVGTGARSGLHTTATSGHATNAHVSISLPERGRGVKRRQKPPSCRPRSLAGSSRWVRRLNSTHENPSHEPCRHSAVETSRPAAVPVSHMRPARSLLAPGRPAASAASVRAVVYEIGF